MWDLLQQAAVDNPVIGNTAGSYTSELRNSKLQLARS